MTKGRHPNAPPALVEIHAEIHADTDKAIQLYDGCVTAWVPRKYVEDNYDGTFTMPEWLAADKGFI